MTILGFGRQSADKSLILHFTAASAPLIRGIFKMKAPLIVATFAILFAAPAFSATRGAHARHHPRKTTVAKVAPMGAKCPMMGKMDMPMDESGAMKMKEKAAMSPNTAMSPDMMAKCMKTEPAPAKPTAGPNKDN